MEKLQLILLEIGPILSFYIFSATKSMAEWQKLKDLYKVTSFSKCMFLKALNLGKGMAGAESLWERIPRCLTLAVYIHLVRVVFFPCNEYFHVTQTPCLFQKEFQDQLKLFEKELPHVSRLAVDSLLKEHEQKLSYSTAQIQHLFNRQLEDWENVKVGIVDILECFQHKQCKMHQNYKIFFLLISLFA